jgi:uncharacterized protein YcbX
MHLSEINIYPVKSLKGIGLSESIVEDRGLRYDRRWMLVDATGQFLTQREYPIMARITIGLKESDFVAACDGSEISVPLSPDTDEFRPVKIWSSTVRSEVYPGEVNDWFSRTMGVECSLVSMPEGAHRAVSPSYAVRRFKDVVSFADGYPFLLLGEASLADLNSRLAEPVPMNRFRPNFVVTGGEAFAEDNWKIIRIGTTIFHVVKPSERCVLTTVDQDAGRKTGVEPLRTLSIFRNKGGKVLFGQNLIAENVGETIRVGDNVQVLERE